jgi:hypothetical protein
MSDLVAIDEVVHFDFTTRVPGTGAGSDADSTPTFDVYEEANDTGMLGATNATKRTSLTGNYRGTFTASAANGFEAGKWYNVIASATVNSVSDKAVVMRFRCGPAEGVAGVPKVDLHAISGSTANVTALMNSVAVQKYQGPFGPGIYFDDGAANTNTVLGTDGTYNNPVSSLAAAQTLASSLGNLLIYVAGGSALALTGGTLTGYTIAGIGSVSSNILNLGTAASPSALTSCVFYHLTVYGTHDFTDLIELRDCLITDAPAAEITKLRTYARGCGIADDISLDTSDDNIFDQCLSAVAGNSYPVINATGVAGTVVFRHHSGGIGFNSLSASHKVSVETDGQVVFESGCNVNAEVAIRGCASITDNTAGMVNITDKARFDTDQIKAEADQALTDYDPATGAEVAAVPALVRAEMDANSTVLAAILNDTDVTIPALIAALEDLSAAEVKAQMVAALSTDTYAQPGSVLPATATLVEILVWLGAKSRNKLLQTAALQTLRNDPDTGDIATAVVSDDGTTATRSEFT